MAEATLAEIQAKATLAEIQEDTNRRLRQHTTESRRRLIEAGRLKPGEVLPKQLAEAIKRQSTAEAVAFFQAQTRTVEELAKMPPRERNEPANREAEVAAFSDGRKSPFFR